MYLKIFTYVYRSVFRNRKVVLEKRTLSLHSLVSWWKSIGFFESSPVIPASAVSRDLNTDLLMRHSVEKSVSQVQDVLFQKVFLISLDNILFHSLDSI